MRKIATTLRLAVAMLALSVAVASAQALVSEPAQLAGEIDIDLMSRPQITPNSTAFAGVVYDNSTSAANTGFSSTSLTSIWGDELFTTNAGILSGLKFTIFNSGSSLGSLLTANCAISFYDGATAAYLGGFTTNVNFGTGLAKGFYSFVNVTGLDVLAITLGTTDVIVTQQVTSKTGTANRLGFVSLDPPTVGSSDPDFYANSATVGAAGWYTLSVPANLGYQVTVANLPVPSQKSTWGRLKSLYR
ncbi:MAG: hypothetical protein HZA61_08795 [Candidatus Eisenbacteria bacterium]|uniref:PEP-CTERM sorting domain-containing protein n=1 Tax=Eiseniibacteriota bacterium TaxID=2212470 RepID=A0A933W934_UNCEI|nr:hypothetical protein [Candidatus Eisenbacteria bacterium]